jgi:glycosyltransferase involved in cell wall biosynthesis
MTENHMKQKRILIFSTAYIPFVGGAEIAIKEITDRLGSGFECDVITAKFNKELSNVERVGAATVYRVGFGNPLWDKLLLPFVGATKAWKLEKQHDYFCLWAMMVTFGSGAAYVLNILRWIIRKRRIPIILTLQEGDSEAHLRYRWAGLIALSWKLALWNTDMLTAISNFLLHRAENIGYDGARVLVPNGVDTKIFTKKIPETQKRIMRNVVDKKEGDVYLVTTSRLTHKNAVDDIISALVLLPEHIQLIVIGRGEEGQKLQELANKLGVSARVKFIGFVDYANIPKYFSVCDIFVRPSRSEGFGNSFIEAMAAGLPVIATPVGGIVDFIDVKETGVFCAPDNPKSLSLAVKLLLDDPVLVAKITAQAKSRVVERYSWDCVPRQMREVFDTVHVHSRS